MSMIQMLTSMSGRVVQIINIVEDTRDYVLNIAKVSNYIAGQMDVILIIASGVYVGSNTIGAALTIDNSWDIKDSVTVINNGTISGKGGTGGTAASTAPVAGGLALQALRSVKITNNGIISGGGGGGGAGAGNYGYTYDAKVGDGYIYAGGGGGGGGVGYSAGIGGSGGGVAKGGWVTGSTPNYLVSSTAGNSSTRTAIGTGGTGAVYGFTSNGWYAYGSPGGAGGTYASAGADGSNINGSGWYARQTGAAGGACTSGNSNITWLTTGTRYGILG